MKELSSLPFKYNDLEPYFDEATMKVHHMGHHKAYTDKLNAALEPYPDLQDKDLTTLIYQADKALPEQIRTAVVNNGGGYLNHNFFWSILGKPADVQNEPTGTSIGVVFEDQYGSYREWKDAFAVAATGLFGSGWTWLVGGANGKLEIINTPNQTLPPVNKPVFLGLDLWEHAYYLKYQNRRPEYVNAFYHVINWSAVDKLFKQSGFKPAEKPV